MQGENEPIEQIQEVNNVEQNTESSSERVSEPENHTPEQSTFSTDPTTSERQEVLEGENTLQCAICRDVPTNTVCGACGHLYCAECLDIALNYQSNDESVCAICRQIIKRTEVRRIFGVGKTDEATDNPFPLHSNPVPPRETPHQRIRVARNPFRSRTMFRVGPFQIDSSSWSDMRNTELTPEQRRAARKRFLTSIILLFVVVVVLSIMSFNGSGMVFYF
ncbi:hypothetical protein PCE1_000403 [Barthelona sp. PCE]